ncbi:MAG: hypothetical protein NY202_02330 [Mollicutes bacterium UO1]
MILGLCSVIVIRFLLKGLEDDGRYKIRQRGNEALKKVKGRKTSKNA